MPTSDERKDFILTGVANYFGLQADDNVTKSFLSSKVVDRFLDDGSVPVIIFTRNHEGLLQAHVDFTTSTVDDQVLIFFKIKPEAITLDNLHKNVLLSSLFESPATVLYHVIKKVFGPLLLNNDNAKRLNDQKLQSLFGEFEAGLASYLRHGRRVDPKDAEAFHTTIAVPADEFQYWVEVLKDGKDAKLRECAAAYVNIFEKSKYLLA